MHVVYSVYVQYGDTDVVMHKYFIIYNDCQYIKQLWKYICAHGVYLVCVQYGDTDVVMHIYFIYINYQYTDQSTSY